MYPKYAVHLVEKLYEIGSIAFGEVILKSGLKSPFYVDMRLLVSHPELLKYTTDLMHDLLKTKNLDYDIICGVPYGAIGLATSLSLTANKPMIFRRKDVKSHGTKKSLEGQYNKADRCIIIEDVVVYGESILETKNCLVDQGLVVTDCITVLDRQQGGGENIEKNGVKYHSLITANDVLEILYEKNKITKDLMQATTEFLRVNNCIRDPSLKIKKDLKIYQDLDYESRSTLCENPISKSLFDIMGSKRTNLCLSADVTQIDELLQLAEELGPHICMLKTHVDILTDFDLNKMKRLKDIAQAHRFLIFEDRKFADIGNTVQLQYTKGVHRISEWSHIVNAHSIAGPGTIEGLKKATGTGKAACLLIAEMSSDGNLITDDYTSETLAMANDYPGFVIGFISQKQVSNNPCHLHLSPGVQLEQAGDTLGQRYITPEYSILNNKSDIIIVGRGILNHIDRLDTAIEYKKRGYNAYLKRLGRQKLNGFQ